jgi:hypothetical protein
MKSLSEEEYLIEAAPFLRQIFGDDDPFGQPFTDAIEVRRILYAITYRLPLPLLKVLANAASEVGDEGFYFSVLERPAMDQQDRPYHWYIPFAELEQYYSLDYPFVLENVLYSPSGQWGIMVSHEEHALLGGSTQFMSRLQDKLPPDSLEEFLSFWKYARDHYQANIAWLPKQLIHVYGYETAQRLLSDSTLPSL